MKKLIRERPAGKTRASSACAGEKVLNVRRVVQTGTNREESAAEFWKKFLTSRGTSFCGVGG
jgi:hypothetical protein